MPLTARVLDCGRCRIYDVVKLAEAPRRKKISGSAHRHAIGISFRV